MYTGIYFTSYFLKQILLFFGVPVKYLCTPVPFYPKSQANVGKQISAFFHLSFYVSNLWICFAFKNSQKNGLHLFVHFCLFHIKDVNDYRGRH
jgi:hypothetical protein